MKRSKIQVLLCCTGDYMRFPILVDCVPPHSILLEEKSEVK